MAKIPHHFIFLIIIIIFMINGYLNFEDPITFSADMAYKIYKTNLFHNNFNFNAM